jgi:hypothetical protein
MLPKQVQRVVKDGRDLLREAKGLGSVVLEIFGWGQTG